MTPDCEQIQFYIQQQFDIDLSFEDEQAVLAHLDSCTLCSRYRSQIEQMIVFAQDLPIAEELLPSEYESLVSRVAEHLPKPTLSPLELVVDFFGKVLGLKSKGTSIIRPRDSNSAILFPHIRRAIETQQRSTALLQREEQTATRGFVSETESRVLESQASGDSGGLGKKFGVDLSQEEETTTGPRTLAESIRHNVNVERSLSPRDTEPSIFESKPRQITPPSQWRPLETLMPGEHEKSEAPSAGGVAGTRWQHSIQEREQQFAASVSAGTSPNEVEPVNSILNKLTNVLEGQPAVPQMNQGATEPQTPIKASPSPAQSAAAVPPQVSTPSAPVKAPAAAAPQGATAAAPLKSSYTASSGLLKEVEEEEIDTIFTSRLGVAPAAARSVVPKSSAAQSAPPAAQPAPPATPPSATQPPPTTPPKPHSAGKAQKDVAVSVAKAPEPKPDSLLSIDDETMDRIFAENLGVEESVAATTAAKAGRTEETIIESTDEVTAGAVDESIKETPAPTPPIQPLEVQGLSRLDSHAGITPPSGPSQIGAIGKFLLDRQDLQNLEKLTGSNFAESSLRVLTPGAAQDINALLERIAVVPGVLGSVIVGHDGIMVTSNLPDELEAESIAVWSLGIYLNTDNAIKKMGRNSVQQIVAQTTHGYLVIVDFGAGILATVTSDRTASNLLPVMHVITELVTPPQQ